MKAWGRTSPFERTTEGFESMAEYKVHFALARDEVVGYLDPAANGLHPIVAMKWTALKTCRRLAYSCHTVPFTVPGQDPAP